jgi:membrane-anchored protein YejM (alkaline phosphatase superfamily)
MEWHLYMEELDEIIYTLPFMGINEEKPDSLLQRKIDPSILFDGTTLYNRLSEHGIKSYALLRDTYAKSAYSSVSQAGADVIPYSSAADMLVRLRQQLAQAKQQSYFYVYFDGIDHMSHEYEPHSEEYLAELNGLTHLLQTELLDKIDKKVAENTVLLITADHGHVVMKPKETIYLNQWSEVTEALAKSPAGKVIYPWGNTRDVFLKATDDKVDWLVDFLSEKLEGSGCKNTRRSR